MYPELSDSKNEVMGLVRLGITMLARASSNLTVNQWVERQGRETVKYGHETRGTRNQQWLCWRGPAAIYPTDWKIWVIGHAGPENQEWLLANASSNLSDSPNILTLKMATEFLPKPWRTFSILRGVFPEAKLHIMKYLLDLMFFLNWILRLWSSS
jgi:hypothetical protein